MAVTVREPAAVGVMLAEHVAEDPVPDRVQDPLGVKLTVPAGVVAPVAAASVTVAVQLVAWLIATVEGVQLTVVVVECTPVVTVREKVPLLVA